MLQEKNHKAIYNHGIISKKLLKSLYVIEKPIGKFKTKIMTSGNHPYATFPSKNRKKLKYKKEDILILRIKKDNQSFEFIAKLRKWGKFSIPKEIIKKFHIQNHEKSIFEVIKETRNANNPPKRYIDLSKMKKVRIINRKNNFITINRKYCSPITLPRFIKITPDLIELCFLIHGDGHYQKKFYFVNKNPELHMFVIKKFEKIFKIPKGIWKARLLFNHPSNPKKAKEEWKGILNLSEKQFYPSISKCKLKTSQRGNLRVCIDKVIFSNIFKYVLKKLNQLGSKKDNFHALNGLLYAEGGARKNKKGLHKITLSFNNQEKQMFQKILEKGKISDLFKVQQNKMFVVGKWENLYELFKSFLSQNITPFDKHPERCKKALNGFLNHSFTLTSNKYLNILNKRKYFTIKDLVKITSHLPNSIINTLRKPQYSKFITIKGKGINRNPLIISITKEGKKFIKLIELIKEVYNEKCELE